MKRLPVTSTSFTCAVAVFAAMFVSVTQPGATAQEKTLRWKLNTGDRLHVQIDQVSKTTRTVKNNDLVMSSNVSLEMEWVVTAADDTGASITQKFTRMKLRLDTPKSGAVEFDTASDERPSADAKVIAAAIKPLINTTVNTRLSPRGEIVEAKLSDEATAAVKHAVATTQLASLLSTEGMQGMLRQSIFILPEKAVAKDATWESSDTLVTPGGKIVQQHTYTYQGPQEKDAATYDKIGVATSIKVEKKTEDGKTVTPNFKHQQTGEMLFDTKAGRPLESVTVQVLSTSRTIRDIQVDISSKMTSSLSIKPLQAATLQK